MDDFTHPLQAMDPNDQGAAAFHSHRPFRVSDSRLVTSRFTCVCVGNEHKKFFIHSDLLKAHSPYLQTILIENQHDQPDTIALPKQSSVAFQVIAEWFYTGYIPLPHRCPWTQYAILVIAWPLAIKFEIENCANTIIESIKWYLDGYKGGPKKHVPPFILEMIEELELPKSSPLRRFLIDRFIWEMDHHSSFHMDLKRDTQFPGHEEIWKNGGALANDIITTRYLRARTMSAEELLLDPASDASCRYHVHDSGSVCEVMARHDGTVVEVSTIGEQKVEAASKLGQLKE